MKAKLLNFVVGAIIIKEDDEGNVIEKMMAEGAELFNEQQVVAHCLKIRNTIGELNEQHTERDEEG